MAALEQKRILAIDVRLEAATIALERRAEQSNTGNPYSRRTWLSGALHGSAL